MQIFEKNYYICAIKLWIFLKILFSNRKDKKISNLIFDLLSAKEQKNLGERKRDPFFQIKYKVVSFKTITKTWNASCIFILLFFLSLSLPFLPSRSLCHFFDQFVVLRRNNKISRWNSWNNWDSHKKHDPRAFRLAVESSDWLKFVEYLICTIRDSFRIMSFAELFFTYFFFQFCKIDKTVFATQFLFNFMCNSIIAFYKNVSIIFKIIFINE